MKNILQKILLFYGAKLPYHPGKWLIVERLLPFAGGIRSQQERVRRQGVNWSLNPAGLVERSLYFLGVYEIHETVYVKSQVQPDWVICDVGANFGYYAHILSAATDGQAVVHAFEPSSALFAALSANHRLNPSFTQLHPWQLALSDRKGTVSLQRAPEINQGLGRLALEGGSGEGFEDVETCTLDQFANDQSFSRLDFIKMDVEGAEGLVLEGARATILKFKPQMMIEVNPEALTAFGTNAQALLSLVRELGYDIYRLKGRALVPLKQLTDADEYVNAICLPQVTG